MSGRLQGKVAAVSGASAGLGAAVARLSAGKAHRSPSTISETRRASSQGRRGQTGVVETEGLDASHFLDAPQADLWREQTPLKRFGKPDDIAPAVVYLASDESAWMTGEFVVLASGQR